MLKYRQSFERFGGGPIIGVIVLKKYLVGLFALFLVFSLVACSSESSKTSKAEDKNEEKSSEAKTKAEAEAKAAAASSGGSELFAIVLN